MTSMRCFIAIDPGPLVKKNIYDFLNKMKLKDTLYDIKWVKPGNLHITLAFLGQMPCNKVPDLNNSLDEVIKRYKPFSVNLSGFGVFPNLNSPRVFWIGIDESPALINLKQDVNLVLEKLGLDYDKKPFSPHLTLGRIKKPIKIDRELINSLNFTSKFDVNEISLIKSELHREGPRYTNIYTFSL